MAQNAANIEQEAAEEEAMLAAMEEELPTDEELEAQLYGEGFVGFEDDDDDYEDDGLDESEEDMTAEAMAESDAASARRNSTSQPYWPRSLPCSLKNPYRTAKSRSRSMSSPIFPNSMAIRKKHLAFPMRMPGRSWQAQRSSLGRSIC